MSMLAYAAVTLVYSLAAGVLGAGLHELVHWLAAWSHGWQAEIDWQQLETRVAPGTVVKQWELAVFALAPLTTGLLIAPAVWRHLSVPLLIGWGIYTLGGARNDIALALGRQEAVGQAPDSGSTPEAAVEVTD